MVHPRAQEPVCVGLLPHDKGLVEGAAGAAEAGAVGAGQALLRRGRGRGHMTCQAAGDMAAAPSLAFQAVTWLFTNHSSHWYDTSVWGGSGGRDVRRAWGMPLQVDFV